MSGIQEEKPIWYKRLKLEIEDVRKFKGPYVNPYIRLGAYVLITFLTGCIYWGWNGIQELLYKGGSFADLCNGQSDISFITIGNEQYIDCGLRKSEINNLYTIAFTSHFVFSLVGGVLLDIVGPKIVFLGSQVINLTTWLLIFSLPKNKSVLIAGFFIIGLTAESSYVPLLTVSRYFPKNNSFIMTLLGSVRSLSFFVPMILSEIFKTNFFKPESLFKIGIIYAVFGNGLAMLLGGYLLQWKFEVKETMPQKSVELDVLDEVEIASFTSDELINMLNPENFKKKCLLSRMKDLIVSGFKHPQLLEFVLFLISSTLFLTGYGFVNKAQREIFVTSDGKSAVDLFKYFNILTFLPAPLMGMMIDKIGPAYVIFILQFSGFLFYFLITFDFYATKVLACFCYIIAGSISVSSIYCYLNKRFSPKRFGTLMGIVFVSIGAISLTNIPLYDLAVINLKHKAPFNFRPIEIGLAVYMAVAFSIMIYLATNAKRKQPQHIQIESGSFCV
uniref:Major Facilitator Superfamily, putative n=1 Tax=Theileria annulata TaxID=5874 RepID=A0A3B0MTS9_THEAN